MSGGALQDIWSVLLLHGIACSWRVDMSAEKQSLRWVVEKWFGSELRARIRLLRTAQPLQAQYRCVRVEAASQSGPLSIVFFRHGDGSWYVFPPEDKRPAIGVPGHARVSSNFRSGAKAGAVLVA